jgi:uncharacterized membrane protein YuzA (DUF378 family)
MQEYYSLIGLAAVGAIVFLVGLYFAKHEREARR